MNLINIVKKDDKNIEPLIRKIVKDNGNRGGGTVGLLSGIYI